MSGVIDKNGQQWERCNRCAGFVEIESLLYEDASEEFDYGRDICSPCYFAMLIGGPKTLPKEQWKDQLSEEEGKRIAAQVSADIKKHGLRVLTYNADGTITDDSIPPEEEE
jgi:hypothetical protein